MAATNIPSSSSLETIEARLARIEQSLGRVEQLATQAETMMAPTLLDIFDQHIAEHPELPKQLSNLLEIAQAASTPQNTKALTLLLEQLTQAPQLVSTLADILDGYAVAAAPGTSMDNVVQNLGTLLGWLAKDSTKALLDAMPTDGESMQALALLAQSSSKAAKSSPGSIGILGALSKLRSQDAGYALNFSCELLQQLGRGLKQKTHDPKQL